MARHSVLRSSSFPRYNNFEECSCLKEKDTWAVNLLTTSITRKGARTRLQRAQAPSDLSTTEIEREEVNCQAESLLHAEKSLDIITT